MWTHLRRHGSLKWSDPGKRFGLVHSGGSFRLDVLYRGRRGQLDQPGIDGKRVHCLWGGFAIKYANPHNAIAQISRADGSVQGRRRQGLSILQYVFIKVVSLNMFDCDQEMLRTRIAGLQHRLDGDTL